MGARREYVKEFVLQNGKTFRRFGNGVRMAGSGGEIT